MSAETGSQVVTWVPPGHFYSPIVDPKDPHVLALLQRFEELELPPDSGIRLDRDRMAEFFTSISGRYSQLPFVAKQQPGFHYYYENDWFSYGDAIVLGLIMLEFRPKRIVEIGSGFSSAAMIDVNERVLGGEIELAFVEPSPEERLFKLLPEGSRYRSAVRRETEQSVPLDVFRRLQAKDILFIDSTHVTKMASDVNHLVFNVFPVLASGVLIHLHDIFFPFEYPARWILEENRSWNEAYLIRAFLEFNDAFEILFFNHYAARKFPEIIKRNVPLFFKNSGGSLWLQRVK